MVRVAHARAARAGSRDVGRILAAMLHLVLRPLVVLLLATLLFPACFLGRNSVNRPLNAAKLSALTPGQSTQADVLAALGAPNEVVQLGLNAAWRYDHSVQKRTGLALIVVGLYNSDIQQDRVWLFFDAAGTLQCAGSTIEADKAVYELPWSDEHDVE